MTQEITQKHIKREDIGIILYADGFENIAQILIQSFGNAKEAGKIRDQILQGLAVKNRIEELIKKCQERIEFWQNKHDSIDYDNPETWNGYDDHRDLEALCRAQINDEEVSKSKWELILGNDRQNDEVVA